MTVFAIGSFFQMIAVLESFRRCRMHLLSAVTIITAHGELSKVDIPLAAITIKFIANPTVVTCGTLVDRIRFCREHMAIYKTAANILWSADVTGTAAGMAGCAVTFTALVDSLPGIVTYPLLEKAWKG